MRQIILLFSAFGAVEITSKFTSTVYAGNPKYQAYLAFDGNLRTQARTTGNPQNLFILKSPTTYSIDLIKIAAHKPGDPYIVSIEENENGKQSLFLQF